MLLKYFLQTTMCKTGAACTYMDSFFIWNNTCESALICLTIDENDSPFPLVCMAVLLQTSPVFKMAIASQFPMLLPVFQRTLSQDQLNDCIPTLMGALALATTRVKIELRLPSPNAYTELLHQIGFSSDKGVCREEAISCGLYSQILETLKDHLLKRNKSRKDISKILRAIYSWVCFEEFGVVHFFT